tara:strand:- start:6919 stop:7104 length:186 start_codon:yes stop_codon:yes gene_type:complete
MNEEEYIVNEYKKESDQCKKLLEKYISKNDALMLKLQKLELLNSSLIDHNEKLYSIIKNGA